MERQERHWRSEDRSIIRSTYEGRPNRILPKQILSEYCNDSITNACQFLVYASNVVESPLPATRPSSAVHYAEDRSITWVANNQEELYKHYPNEWILVEGESVVAHSANPLALQEIADKKGTTTAFMARVAPPSKPSSSAYYAR
jgi:hypothetical protein